MDLASRFFLLRVRLATVRAARRRRRDLERELAAYQLPHHRADLEATLDRYPDGVTHEYREILAQQAQRQAQVRRQQRWPAIGHL